EIDGGVLHVRERIAETVGRFRERNAFTGVAHGFAFEDDAAPIRQCVQALQYLRTRSAPAHGRQVAQKIRRQVDAYTPVASARRGISKLMALERDRADSPGVNRFRVVQDAGPGMMQRKVRADLS